MAEVCLRPKLLSDPAWVITHSKWAMNLINTQSGTVGSIGTGHESQYSLVKHSSGQLSILSPQHCPVVVVKQSPH